MPRPAHALCFSLIFGLVACGGNQVMESSSISSVASSSSVQQSSSSSVDEQSSSSTSSISSEQAGWFPNTVSTVKIMIVGDSISAGPGCYKKYLDEHLQNANVRDYEFVGRFDDDCGGGIKHSAVSCSTAYNFTQYSFVLPNCFGNQTFPGMTTLMRDHKPDLLMIQLGVNDVWGGNTPVQSVLNNYKTLLDQARAQNPNVVIALAQIHKIITDSCANQASYSNAQNLINALPAWAENQTTEDSPIFVADLWSNSDPYDANDCVHPDDVGARKMAQNWFVALENILSK